MALQIVVGADDFDHVGRLWPGPRTALSPLPAYGPDGTVPQGLTDQQRRVFEVLAGPVASLELIYQAEGEARAVVVYESDGGLAATVFDSDDRVMVAEVGSVHAEVIELTTSLTVDSGAVVFGEQVSAATGWVLAVMVDLQRQACLRAATEDRLHPVGAAVSTNPAAIAATLSTMADSASEGRVQAMLGEEAAWCCVTLVSTALAPSVLSVDAVHSSMLSLVASGLAVAGPHGYALAEPLVWLANTALWPTQMLFVTHARTLEAPIPTVAEQQLTSLISGGAAFYIVNDPEIDDSLFIAGGPPAPLAEVVQTTTAAPASVTSLIPGTQ